MPRILLSSARLRAILSDAITEADVVHILRTHKIRFSLTTSGGALHALVPTRTGTASVFLGPPRTTWRPPFAPVFRPED